MPYFGLADSDAFAALSTVHSVTFGRWAVKQPASASIGRDRKSAFINANYTKIRLPPPSGVRPPPLRFQGKKSIIRAVFGSLGL